MSWTNRFNNEGYKNWLRVGIALLFTRDGLVHVALQAANKLQAELKAKLGDSVENCTCNTKKGQECKDCKPWREELKTNYYTGDVQRIGWSNCTPSKWSKEPWEVAKVFMPKDPTAAADNTGPEKSDPSALLNFLVHCTYCNKYVSVKSSQKVIEVRNKTCHSKDLTFDRQTFNGSMNSMDRLLRLVKDPLTLAADITAKEAADEILKIKKGEFHIGPNIACLDAEICVFREFMAEQEKLLQLHKEQLEDHGTRLDTLERSIPPVEESAKPVVKDSSMWNNRQLKQLVDMGFPREDAEKALKTNNNNLESAIGVLLQKNGVESNSHLDSDSGKDNRNTNRVLPVGRQKRFSSRADDQIPVTSHDEDDSSAFIPISQPNQILKNPSPIPPGQQAGMNKQGVNYNFSLNQNSGAMSSITSSSATPTLPKGGGGGGGGGVGFNPQQPLTPPMNPNQPIRGQMNPLVFQQQMQQHMQMLQMAARNGFLNQALLNPQVAAAASANSGPMSQQVTSLTPQQLKLVQQLLQLSQLQNQQKVLNQQLLQYQGQPGGGTGKGSLNHLQRQQQELAMLIQQMQQQIVNQQRLIAQQSLMQQKQSQKPDHHFGVEPRDQEPRGVGNNVASALGNLNLNVDAGMKEPPLSQSTMQSRLNQWKHPSHQPRDVDSNDDFARKPGAIGRSRSQNNSAHGYGGGPYDSFPPEDPLNHTTVTSPIMSTQSDTWSAISPSPTDASSRSSSQQWSSAIDADLSSMLPPEFKPGEPWKGLKDYANDPDVTPGSVARSISLNMVKDSDILKLTGEQYKSSKDDPASSTSALLSSTTWSFSGSSLYSNTSASGSNKGNVKSTWSSASPLSPSAYPPSTITNEIWRAPLPSKKGVVPARPPPGLNVTKSSMWSSGGGGRGSSGDYNVGGSGGSGGSGWGSVPSMWSGGDTAPPGRQAPSNWLILKNLTPQIDGSTLRTLCMQHGPLLTFHLNLSQGCALVCYMSKEEAAKAQKSLHTCVLGNTTILADFISEDEARRLFEQNNSQAAAASSANDRYNPDRYNVNPSFGGRGDAQHYIGGRGDAQTYPGRGENQSYGTRGGENRGYGGRGDAQAAYGRRNDPPPFSGPPPSDSHWNGSSSVGGLSSMIPGNSMWSIQAGSSGGGGWGTGNDTDARGVVSPNALSTLLPGDLLGGENM